MTDLPHEQLTRWTDAIDRLHDYTTRNHTDARIATEATANLWSDFGYQAGPPEVSTMILHAIETGYAAALRDVRDGDIDDLIEEWQSEREDD
ncbi:MAG: hypothetical protein H0V92_08610 [Pseudonocardiales bacterium]|nr:hypothetical protein [Pseudonocardiales bacterium]